MSLFTSLRIYQFAKLPVCQVTSFPFYQSHNSCDFVPCRSCTHAGQREQGEELLQQLKEEDESAYDLLDTVPRECLAPCFLPEGVYTFGVRTSNWIEILWETLRRIGLRKQPCFLHQLMYFCMYSVVRYRQLCVKAKGLRQLTETTPTKEMASALVRNTKALVDRGCTVKQKWNEEMEHVVYSVKVPVRCVLGTPISMTFLMRTCPRMTGHVSRRLCIRTSFLHAGTFFFGKTPVCHVS